MNALADTLAATLPTLEAGLTLLFVGAYVAVAVIMRWSGTAQPQRDHYTAEREVVLSHLHALWSGSPPGNTPLHPGADERELRFRAAAELLEEARKALQGGFRPLNFLFWCGGDEHAALHHIRQADRLLVFACSRDEAIARLHAVHEGLRQWGTPAARAHAAYLAEFMKGDHADHRVAAAAGGDGEPRDRDPGAAPAQGIAVHRTERLRAELEQAMQVWDDEELERFRRRADRQNRAMWLTGLGLLLITALAAAEGNAILFLAGAAGGFLGRLMRVVGPENGKTDFGLASASLLFSPVAGAVAGWTGVLLLSAIKLQDLSTSWDELSTASLALAVLFGFSELLFNRLLSGFESRVGPAGRGTTAARAPVGAGGIA